MSNKPITISVHTKGRFNYRHLNISQEKLNDGINKGFITKNKMTDGYTMAVPTDEIFQSIFKGSK